EFDYFLIDPKTLEHHRDVFFELQDPACPHCPWGVHRVSSIRLRHKVTLQLDVARIGSALLTSVELLFSRSLMRALEEIAVTGIRIESTACQAGFVGTIDNTRLIQARDIVIGSRYCNDHSYVFSPYLIDSGLQGPEPLTGDFVVFPEV